MARFFGRDSRYLLQRDYEYFGWAIFMLVLPVAAVYVVYALISPAAAAFAVVAIFFVLKWMQPLIYFFKTKSDKYRKGRFGEKDIKKELRQLPDSYAVFEGVMLDSSHGDIDFVLVGPKGVVSLEVKSLGGSIGYDGTNITINGKKMKGRNYLAQAYGEARAISVFLRTHLNVDIYTKPVLLFSNPYASMEFGTAPVDNVFVTQKDFLFTVLHSFPDYEWQRGEREKVEALLAITVNK